MKAEILLYVFLPFVNSHICREIFCKDHYASEMKVTRLQYNLTNAKSAFVESRILKTISFRKIAYNMRYHNPSNIVFDLNEYAYGEGYEFKQGGGQFIPAATLKKMRVPNHKSEGLFAPEYDSRKFRFDKVTNFFHAQNTKLSRKCTCSGMDFHSSQCSIIETKWIYLIPYDGTLINKKKDCECGSVSGNLIYHTDFSVMIKIREKIEPLLGSL